MRRRSFLAGLLAGGCTPLAGPSTDDEPTAERTVEPVVDVTESTLLAVAEWSGMMDSSSLALYANGLVDRRFVTEIGNGEMMLPTYRREFRVAMLPPSEVERLRRDLESSAFEGAEPVYREEGVMDGGALTIAGVESRRRIIVVNEPARLPAELARLSDGLWELAQYVERKGEDPFGTKAPPEGRMLLVHEFWRRDFTGAHELTVFDSGMMEFRITNDPRDEAHAKRDFPTPRSVVRRLSAAQLDEVRATVLALRGAGLNEEYADQGAQHERDRHWLRAPGVRHFVATDGTIPAALQRAIDLGTDLAAPL